MFLIEIALFVTPVVLFMKPANRTSRRGLFIGAVAMLLGGALYRLDGFLVAYETGPGWHYFPSVSELMVTIGIIAAEILLYIVFVRKFPVFYTTSSRRLNWPPRTTSKERQSCPSVSPSTPSPGSKAICASTSKSTAARCPRLGRRAKCGAAWN